MAAGTDPAQLLRDGHAAFNDRDRDRLLESIADDVTWHSPGNSPLSGTYNSRDETWEGFFASAWEAPLTIEDEQILGTDEHAVALTQVVVTLGDDERRWKLLEVVRVDDGQVTERWAFLDRQDEFDRFMEQAG